MERATIHYNDQRLVLVKKVTNLDQTTNFPSRTLLLGFSSSITHQRDRHSIKTKRQIGKLICLHENVRQFKSEHLHVLKKLRSLQNT